MGEYGWPCQPFLLRENVDDARPSALELQHTRTNTHMRVLLLLASHSPTLIQFNYYFSTLHSVHYSTLSRPLILLGSAVQTPILPECSTAAPSQCQSFMLVAAVTGTTERCDGQGEEIPTQNNMAQQKGLACFSFIAEIILIAPIKRLPPSNLMRSFIVVMLVVMVVVVVKPLHDGRSESEANTPASDRNKTDDDDDGDEIAKIAAEPCAQNPLR